MIVFKQQQFSNMVCILFILVIKRGQCHEIRILEPFPKFPLINSPQEKKDNDSFNKEHLTVCCKSSTHPNKEKK